MNLSPFIKISEYSFHAQKNQADSYPRNSSLFGKKLFGITRVCRTQCFPENNVSTA